MQAFAALRTEAKANGVSDMSTDYINQEIDLARRHDLLCCSEYK